MAKRFCPKCGATITEGIFCDDCAVKEFKYEPPLIQVSEFQRTFHKGSWHHFGELDHLIKKRVCEALGRDIDIEIEPYEFIPKSKEKITITVHVDIDGQKMSLPVKISYRQCDYGQKERTQYFEGILQLRNPPDEIRGHIQRELKKVAHKGVFVTKVEETDNGVDLYMTSKNGLRILAQKLANQFGGSVNLNPQLFSRNHLTSKDIYRLNVLLEFPPFTKGDVISFSEVKNDVQRLVLVKSMGKIIHSIDLESGKNLSFELKFTKDLVVQKVLESKVLAIIPDLMLMHPTTYQGIIPTNSALIKDKCNLDDKISVVITEKGFFALPRAESFK